MTTIEFAKRADGEQVQRLIQESLYLYNGMQAKADGIELDRRHMDASVPGLLAQALTYYDPNLLREEYTQFKYADPNLLIPENPMQQPGLDTIEKQWIRRVGAWKMVGAASKNYEPIDIDMRSVRYGTKYFGAFIHYSSQDLDRMAAARSLNQVGVIVDLVREKMRAVTEAFDQLKNEMNSLGLPALGLYGIHTHPNIPRKNAAYQMGLNKTAEQNIAILNDITNTIQRLSNQATFANTMIMPNGLLNDLSIQLIGTSGTKSVIQWWLENNRFIKNIEFTKEVDTAGTGGTSIIHAYRREPGRLESMIPKRMTQLAPPQFNAGRWEVHFDAQVAGVHVNRPLDHLILENVYAVS